MFYYVFFALFTLALIIANVYCFKSKKYLYLFVPCMLFLPGYYGIELSESLPLITMTRIMFVVFYIYTFINKRRTFKTLGHSYKSLPKAYYLLLGYFVLRIASNLYYITTYGQAIKTIFSIVFEQALFLIAVYMLAPTKKEIRILIKVIVWTATAFFLSGIFESITSVRIFDALYTVSRAMLNDHYIRLGLLRATATMGLPGFYGNMCMLILPLILYLYECEKTKKYLLSIGLCFLAIIHSGSRSNILFSAFVIAVYFIFVFKDKDRRLLFFKNCLVIIIALSVFICLASAISPNLRYFYVGSGKSVLNEFGFEFDIAKDAPSGVEGYGGNPNGTISRTRQFTGMYYAFGINPLFGLGSGAQLRGDVQYYWPIKDVTDKWMVVKSYDMGIVEIFCDEGILGLLGMTSLLIFMCIKSKRNKYYQLSLLSYFLAMFGTSNMYSFLMLFIIVYSIPLIEDNEYVEQKGL